MSDSPAPRSSRRSLAGRLARRIGVQRTAAANRVLATEREKRAEVARKLKAAQQNNTRLKETIESQSGELERLRAHADADSRDRTDLSYLFVVTYGRSGSTLLQGILSATPGVVIRGENGAVLQDLFRFHDTVLHHRNRLTASRSNSLPESHPWWGIDGYRDETALRNMRLLMLESILRPAPDTRVIGFKEIYWMRERMADYLQFVQAVFPGARFVLNTRDLDEVATSKWWARRPNAREELRETEDQYVAGLEKVAAGNYYRVHYNDYVADPTVLKRLFEWLGEEWDEDRVRAVMQVRHSY